ncbi:MAG: DUF3568 family protein [Deltaproteobacteria bacterium]|nr:DUF3568 family protein [Deltaproteobacteria bacterium]
MPKRGSIILLIGLLAAIVSLAACKGTVVNTQGQVPYELKRSMTAPNYWETFVNGDIETIHSAILAGIGDLGLTVKEDTYDKVSGIVEGSFADNSNFTVKLAREADGTIQIRIKVGLTGNKDRSVQLFQAMSTHF